MKERIVRMDKISENFVILRVKTVREESFPLVFSSHPTAMSHLRHS